MIKSVAAAVLSAAILLATATGTQASTHHPKPITRAQAAKQYLADVVPVNAVTNSDGVTVYVATVAKFDTLILRQRWPADTRADIKALAEADAAVSGDYESASSSNVLNASSLTATTRRDAEAANAAANIVRADLGLPAPPQ